MRIIVICKDMGGYISKLKKFLEMKGHQVLFLDTSQSVSSFKFISGKLGRTLRTRLGDWRNKRKIKAFAKADYLLVVNPGQISPSVITCAFKHAVCRKAYLYDSLARSPVSMKSLQTYEEVFSFDRNDVAAHGFKKLYNFMYESVPDSIPISPRPFKAFLVMAGLDRLELLNKIAAQLEQAGFPRYNFIVQYKRTGDTPYPITFSRERLHLEQVQEYIKDADILIDLLRPQQSGLSFRIFEAMLYQRKVITDNPSVVDYDFYHPDNILVIDPKNPQIPAVFLAAPYCSPPEHIYRKYSLEGWCETVFQ